MQERGQGRGCFVIVTASATVLSWLLKTLMLKKKVLPLTVKDVVPQTLKVGISGSAYCSVVGLQLVREQMAPKILVKTAKHLHMLPGPFVRQTKKGAQRSK